MHINTLDNLTIAYTNGALAHAYLFTGAEGAGKRKTARVVSAMILGVEEERLPLHPDYIALERGGKHGDKEIRIEEVRELKNRLALTSALGGWRIAIIERVELLSREAVSALLKVLEEPGERTALIMTTDCFGAVLPTIRSRAVRVLFPPPQKSAIDALPTETKKELDTFFSEVHGMPLGARFAVSERYAKDATALKDYLRYAAETLRGMLVQSVKEGKTQKSVAALVRSLLRTDALLTHTNTNARLALDVFLMQF